MRWGERTIHGALLGGLLGLALASSGLAQDPGDLVTRGAAAGADVELLQELRTRAEGAGLGAEDVSALLRPAVSAAEAGRPSGLLIQKGLEGLSKGVPSVQIAQVLTVLEGAVERATGLVDPWLERPGVEGVLAGAAGAGGAGAEARARVVESVALALQVGASEEAIGTLLDRVPRGLRDGRVSALRLGVAAEVLAEIPVAAEDPAMAAEVVLEALNSGFGAAELRELPAAMQAAARRGELPAATVARGALSQMLDGLPAASVLENLFQGEFPGNAPFDLPPGLERLREGGPPGPPPTP